MHTSRAIMTIRRTRIPFILLVISLCASELAGQVRDFQSWWELEFRRGLTDRVDLEGEIEQRFGNNSLQYSRSLVSLGASFDQSEYFTLGGGARIVLLPDGEQGIRTRYRFHLDGTGHYELARIDLSLRTRLQYGFEEITAFRYFINALVNRNRLKVEHHIFGTRIGWFASLESWHGSGNEYRWLTFAMRYSAGISFTPSFRSGFSLRYILEDEFNVRDPMQLHVLVLGYSHRF